MSKIGIFQTSSHVTKFFLGFDTNPFWGSSNTVLYFVACYVLHNIVLLCVISAIDVVLNCLLCAQYSYVVHDILMFRLMRAINAPNLQF